MSEFEPFFEEEATYNSRVLAEVDEQCRREDPVAQKCEQVVFVSRSKGRLRRRKFPEGVELLCCNGRCWSMRGDGSRGPTDEIATEVLGDTVRPEDALETFLDRVRKLKTT